MKAMLRLCPLALFSAAVVWLAAYPSQARAAFLFTLTQAGGNVVVNGSGTINTTALTLTSTNFSGAGSVLSPTNTVLAVDPASINVEQFSGVSGPAAWGNGGSTNPGTSSGNAVVISGPGVLYVPLNYAGTMLSDTMTFTGATFASLGFTPGTYTYSWGAGANADSLTVSSAAPEPPPWALLGVGVAGLGVAARRRALRRA